MHVDARSSRWLVLPLLLGLVTAVFTGCTAAQDIEPTATTRVQAATATFEPTPTPQPTATPTATPAPQTTPTRVPVAPTIQEVSRHPADMPDSANYTLYRDGKFTNPVTRSGPLTIEVHFQIKEGIAEVVPGTFMQYWTFDGAVPGPMIRARIGDTVDFYLTNPSDNLMPHNVDFHAVTGSGGGSVVLDTLPGATSRLKVKMLRPGIYIYHCAFPDIPTHISHGMYGLIVVEPEGGLPAVDHEYYLMQSEWYTTAGATKSAAELQEMGLLPFSVENGNLEQPTFVTWNGRPGSTTGDRAIGVYRGDSIKAGDSVRLFVGDIGPNLVSSFHVIGEIFDTVYVEGSFALENQWVQSTLIPAGGAAGVEFTVDVPGDFLLVDHSIYRIHKGAAGVIHVTGDPDPEIYNPINHSEGLR